jgi:hypothetical protein
MPQQEACETSGHRRGVSWRADWRGYLCDECAREIADVERDNPYVWQDSEPLDL